MDIRMTTFVAFIDAIHPYSSRKNIAFRMSRMSRREQDMAWCKQSGVGFQTIQVMRLTGNIPMNNLLALARVAGYTFLFVHEDGREVSFTENWLDDLKPPDVMVKSWLQDAGSSTGNLYRDRSLNPMFEHVNRMANAAGFVCVFRPA